MIVRITRQQVDQCNCDPLMPFFQKFKKMRRGMVLYFQDALRSKVHAIAATVSVLPPSEIARPITSA